MNLNKLMKQAQKMQEQMSKAQAELEGRTVEVQAAGGKVTVVANGAGDVVSLKIAKEIVDPEDVEFLEEAVLSGVKQAIERGKELSAKLIIQEGLPLKDRKDQIENSANRNRAEASPIVREALEMFKGEIKETR